MVMLHFNGDDAIRTCILVKCHLPLGCRVDGDRHIIGRCSAAVIRDRKGDRVCPNGKTRRWIPVLSGFLVSAALFVGVSLVTPPPPEHALRPYFDT